MFFIERDFIFGDTYKIFKSKYGCNVWHLPQKNTRRGSEEQQDHWEEMKPDGY